MARVGPYPIPGALFNRYAHVALSSASSSEPLIPPRFSACVAGLQAQAASLDERAAGASQLESECKKRYQTLLQAALEHLIANEWLIGGARELGVPISDEHAVAGSAVMLEKRAKLAANAIRQALKDRVAPVTQAQVAGYYQRHRFEYLLSGERDLRIARTETPAEATKLKSQIASGKSFASVVSKIPVQQPVDSSDGLVLELEPHFYGEPNLNQAIFTAAPGVLVGPVDTWFGYFVFQVTKIRFERLKPLAQVEAAIRRQLIGPRAERALAAFNKRWSATWTAATDCSPGYVVPKCRQFAGTPLAPPEENGAID